MDYFDYILKNGNAFIGNSIQSETDIGIKKIKYLTSGTLIEIRVKMYMTGVI